MRKVLIANRSEIAVRVIRACKELGIATVAVYSKADADAMHVHMADEALCIGAGPSSGSYLKAAAILSAAEATGADAVHPGYGFLSENARFAQICTDCGINFIGPSSESIALLGHKAKAKQIAIEAGVPTVPGSEGELKGIADAKDQAERVGYPVLLKASNGGGGKGIRVVHSPIEIEPAYMQASLEAKEAFGHSGLYLEKMVMEPRHVEVQVAADQHGHVIHLYERDCSIQRRRQKLVEEALCPVLSFEQREKLCRAAVDLIRYSKYYSLATVEFLLDSEGNFYFMEVNTRVQVEHTVTEELTGIDLIKMQIEIAKGESIGLEQAEIEPRGHVIQMRINAENIETGFSPCPGKIEHFVPPGGPHVRLDSALYPGYSIPPYYDSMLAKLIVRGTDRNDAIRVAKRALSEFYLTGVHTTVDFHRFLMQDPAFIANHYNLNYIDTLIAEGASFRPGSYH